MLSATCAKILLVECVDKGQIRWIICYSDLEDEGSWDVVITTYRIPSLLQWLDFGISRITNQNQ